jgi:hypothetical protein
MKASSIILSAAVLAATPAHAELRTWRFAGTVVGSYRVPDTPSLLPVPDPSDGDAYQLDITYDTKTPGFNTFEACDEYAAIKSVTLTAGDHSARLTGPAVADFGESLGWITVCNDSATYRGDTVFIQTVGVFSVQIDLRGRSDLLDDTKLPSVPPISFPSRTLTIITPTRSFGSPTYDGDAIFGSITNIVALKRNLKSR